MFFEQFKRMCEKKGKKPATVLSEIGIRKSNATNWKNGSMPSLAVLVQLADYFECSLDCLMERDYSDNKNQYDINCEGLNSIGIKKVQEYIKDLMENPKYTEKPSISESMSKTIAAVDSFTTATKQK